MLNLSTITCFKELIFAYVCELCWNLGCGKKWCHKNHKLLHHQSYHKIFSYWDVYLLKNYHEPYSAKMVPTSKFLVPGSMDYWHNWYEVTEGENFISIKILLTLAKCDKFKCVNSGVNYTIIVSTKPYTQSVRQIKGHVWRLQHSTYTWSLVNTYMVVQFTETGITCK